MRSVGFVAPFLGEDVFYSAIASAASSETLHGDSARCPNHSLAFTVKVEFNAFLTPINIHSFSPSARKGGYTFSRKCFGILLIVMRNQCVDQLGPKLSPFPHVRKGN